jgi:hypothetical protein
MRSNPTVDDPLDIQDALQPCLSLSIEILTPTIGATPSSQSRILSFVVIRMHLCHRRRAIGVPARSLNRLPQSLQR